MNAKLNERIMGNKLREVEVKFRVNETKIKELRVNINSKHLRPIKSHDRGVYDKK